MKTLKMEKKKKIMLKLSIRTSPFSTMFSFAIKYSNQFCLFGYFGNNPGKWSTPSLQKKKKIQQINDQLCSGPIYFALSI